MKGFIRLIPLFFFISLALLIIIGLASRDKLNQYLSKSMKQAVPHVVLEAAAEYVDSAYNYTRNEMTYQITFLEFGSTGCSACRKMEDVMMETVAKYPNRVNVVFWNVTEPKSQMLMKYYGVVAIPTQILLNNEGEEFYRHIGFIKASKLRANFGIID